MPGKYVLRVCFESPFTRIISSEIQVASLGIEVENHFGHNYFQAHSGKQTECKHWMILAIGNIPEPITNISSIPKFKQAINLRESSKAD